MKLYPFQIRLLNLMEQLNNGDISKIVNNPLPKRSPGQCSRWHLLYKAFVKSGDAAWEYPKQRRQTRKKYSSREDILRKHHLKK